MSSNYKATFQKDSKGGEYGLVYQNGVTVNQGNPIQLAWLLTQNQVSNKSQSTIGWQVDYNVSFSTGDITVRGAVYSSQGTFGASLGDTWFFDGTTENPSLSYVTNSGNPTDNTITIQLNGGSYTNTYSVAVGMNNSPSTAVVASNYVGQTIVYTITPSYQILFGNYTAGLNMSVGISTKPKPLVFGQDHAATIELDDTGAITITYSVSGIKPLFNNRTQNVIKFEKDKENKEK